MCCLWLLLLIVSDGVDGGRIESRCALQPTAIRLSRRPPLRPITRTHEDDAREEEQGEEGGEGEEQLAEGPRWEGSTRRAAG